MLNRIVIMGRLVRDPELRRTGNGTAVAALTLAVDRDYKSPERRKGDGLHRRCSLALHGGVRQQVLHKGRMAVVEGRLQIRDWTDKDGGAPPQRRGGGG